MSEPSAAPTEDPAARATAAAGELDRLVDRMAGDLVGLRSALADLSRLAVAWHDVAVRAEDHDPALAAQLDDVVAAIRTAGAGVDRWADDRAALAGRAGRVADHGLGRGLATPPPPPAATG
jgi:hypothetical protein